MKSTADEIRKLQELLESGAISNDEFTQAKKSLLEAKPPADSAVELQVAELQLQNQLLRIDQDWEKQHEGLKVLHGETPAEPTQGGMFGSVFAGAWLVVFGMIWIALTSLSLFSIPGVACVVFGIAAPIYYRKKFSAFRLAHDAYRRRRAKICRELEALKEEPSKDFEA